MIFESKYENDSLYIIINNNSEVIFQRAPYIEDGWYIKLQDGYYEVWDIPLGGGYDGMVDKFFNFEDAYKFAEGLWNEI